MADFIAYYRISPGGRRAGSKKELQSDLDRARELTLGLQAQQRDVTSYLNRVDGARLIKEFTEVESGRSHKNRPILRDAIRECRRRKATLIIAKLDRLARNVNFVSGLMEAKVPFLAVDMPTANELTIHILVAVAEDERKRISRRIKDALGVLKAKGVKLGNKDLAEHRKKAATRFREKFTAVSPETRLLINEWRRQGKTLKQIADALNQQGVKTPMEKNWHASSVKNQLKGTA